MKPILVHLHIYYENLYSQLIDCIKNIYPYEFDLIVTMNKSNDKIESDIKYNFPNSKIMIVDNKGFDIGPFIEILRYINLNDYSYVIKLHTKRDLPIKYDTINKFYIDRAYWRNYLLSFINSKINFNKTIEYLENNENCGMCGSFKITLTDSNDIDKITKQNFIKFLSKYNLKNIPFKFIGGTMFIIRANLLNQIKNLNLKIDDFDKSFCHKPQLAHVIERYFGYIVYNQGYFITDALYSMLNQYTNLKLMILKEFFLYKKITTSNHLLIRMCKIPILNKKIKTDI